MTQYQTPEIIPAWAEAGDKNDIPTNAEVQEGWPMNNTPPTRQRFNWLLNWLSRGVRSWMQLGIPMWNPAEDYPIYAKVLDPHTGKTFQAKRANTNADPENSPNDWERWGYSASDPNIDNVPTAPIWDNDNTVVNSEWVNRNGVFIPGRRSTVDTTVANSDFGGIIIFEHGAVTRTATLPKVSTVPVGRCIWVQNRCTNTAGIAAIAVGDAGDRISVLGPATGWSFDDTTSVQLILGEAMLLRSTANTTWEVVEYKAQRATTFSATTTGNRIATLDAVDARINALLVGSLKLALHNGTPEAGYILANGAVLPQASYPALFNKLTFASTGNNTSGQDTITGIASSFFTQAQLGMPMMGPGVPFGATLIGLNAGTSTIRISAATTGGSTGGTYRCCPWGVGDATGTQFQVPDFRGEFMRGFDFGRGADLNRVFGVLQAGDVQSHDHLTLAQNYSLFISNQLFTSGGNASVFQGSGGNQRTGTSGGTETRPRNHAVQIMIKY